MSVSQTVDTERFERMSARTDAVALAAGRLRRRLDRIVRELRSDSTAGEHSEGGWRCGKGSR